MIDAVRYTPESVPPVRPPPARPCSREQYLRERFSLPAEWRAVEWRGLDVAGKPVGVFVRGAVYLQRFQRGPRKGRLNLKKPELGTELAWTISQDEWQAWQQRWEAEEGLCFACDGTGVEFGKWEKDRGTTMRACRRCRGTGLPPEPIAEDA